MIAFDNIRQFIHDRNIPKPLSTRILERATIAAREGEGAIFGGSFSFIFDDEVLEQYFIDDFHSDASGTMLAHWMLASQGIGDAVPDLTPLQLVVTA